METIAPHGCSDLEHLGPPPAADAALAALDRPLAQWFLHRIGQPTPIQRLAWPALAAGRNLLVSAPTGSGKTLAALLPLLADLHRASIEPITAWQPASLFALYVAPLRALVNDVARNIRAMMAELTPLLPASIRPARVAVRTGDTSAAERRSLQTDPPDLLVTTPESLAVLLSQPALAGLFRRLRWAIVDEVHDLTGSKRGADLALSLERVEELAGAFVQRVGLSATATPLDEAARYLVGVDRPCAIAAVANDSAMQLAVEPLAEDARFLRRVASRVAAELQQHRSILVFANTRRLAERLGRLARLLLPDLHDQIAVHHSSLAAERRRDVEEQFKRGELRVVVSSTTLELGIDIGPIDLVVLIHPPRDVVRLLQRIGRGGHAPGRVRRGLVLTAGPAELLEATVTVASGRAGQCEPLRVCAAPLDVLCQHLVGMAAGRAWSAREAYALLRRAYCYRDLHWDDFRACLEYLFGRAADGQEWLPPRLAGDADSFTIRDSRTARLLRRNLGTILTEPGYTIRLSDDARAGDDNAGEPEPIEIGSVDPAFGDRLQPGDRFLLDGRCLEFRRRDDDDVLVREVAGRPAPPLWDGLPWPLSLGLARRLFQLRTEAAEALREGPLALAALLRGDYRLAAPAVALLSTYFQRQEAVSEIPDGQLLLVEVVDYGDGADWYCHTPLPRPANDALARVAVHRLARDHGRAAASFVADLGFVLQFRTGGLPAAETIRPLLSAERFDDDLDAALAASDSLREQFRQVATTGLMLLRQPLGGRRRVGGVDWAARRLFEQVRERRPDFALLRQALREVRERWCDAASARAFAEALPRLTVRVRALSRPSPFAQSWSQGGDGADEPIETPAEALQRLHAALTGRAARASAG